MLSGWYREPPESGPVPAMQTGGSVSDASALVTDRETRLVAAGSALEHGGRQTPAFLLVS